MDNKIVDFVQAKLRRTGNAPLPAEENEWTAMVIPKAQPGEAKIVY